MVPQFSASFSAASESGQEILQAGTGAVQFAVWSPLAFWHLGQLCSQRIPYESVVSWGSELKWQMSAYRRVVVLYLRGPFSQWSITWSEKPSLKRENSEFFTGIITKVVMFIENAADWHYCSFHIYAESPRAHFARGKISMTCRTYAGVRRQPLITASPALLISLIFSLWCARHNLL